MKNILPLLLLLEDSVLFGDHPGVAEIREELALGTREEISQTIIEFISEESRFIEAHGENGFPVSIVINVNLSSNPEVKYELESVIWSFKNGAKEEWDWDSDSDSDGENGDISPLDQYLLQYYGSIYHDDNNTYTIF